MLGRIDWARREQIAEGAFGKVFRVPAGGSFVAVKEIARPDHALLQALLVN
jgi:hypothetical protein